jgi:hypothetical protein
MTNATKPPRDVPSHRLYPRDRRGGPAREVREQAGDRETLYAIGSADGQQLALVDDRKLAFVVARQNDMEPVSVH